MRGAIIKVAVAIAIVAISYIVSAFVLPRLGLRVGFEGGMVLQGLTVAFGIIAAGAICAVAALQLVRTVRRGQQKGVAAYSLLGVAILIALFALYVLIDVVRAALA